jgi:hypothetical protein
LVEILVVNGSYAAVDMGVFLSLDPWSLLVDFTAGAVFRQKVKALWRYQLFVEM